MLITSDDFRSAYDELKNAQRLYDEGSGEECGEVLVLLTPEVDSMCAARILIAMLKSDLIRYKVQPVQHVQQLIEKAKIHMAAENIRTIFLLNCGGQLQLQELLAPQSRITIYVLDSHRPYHLSNVHSEQVKIFHDGLDPNVKYPLWEGNELDDEDEELAAVGPAYDESSEEDESEDDINAELDFGGDDGEGSVRADGSEGMDKDGSPSAKRRRRKEKAEARRARRDRFKLEQMESKRLAREQKARLRREYERDVAVYYSGTSYGAPSSVLMHELSSKSKESNLVLWMCMLGISDQFVHERIEEPRYEMFVSHYSSEITKYNIPLEEQGELLQKKQRENANQAADALVVQVGHIRQTEEFRFPLLRSWSLYHAMKNSSYVASRLKTWTDAGKEKIRALLTAVGVRTVDAREKFAVMSAYDKARVNDFLEDNAKDSRFNLPALRFRNFTMQLTPTLNMSACDLVFALTALAELPHYDSKMRSAHEAWEDKFWRAWKALELEGREAFDLVAQGVKQAIMHQEVILRQGTRLATTHQAIVSGSSFFYVKLQEDADSIFLCRPLSLSKLAFFLFECVITQKGASKPLVICSPIPGAGTYLVIAITGTMLSPSAALRNPYGERFSLAAEPALPEREEEDYELDEDEEERRERLGGEYARLRVKQEAFDSAVVEVQAEDLQTFLDRI